MLGRRIGLRGVVRGREVRTTISNSAVPCPLDRVNRQFHAPRPNALWLSDFTYVATWQGFVYVAFIIDAYAPASSAGASAARPMPLSCWTPWSRPWPTAVPSRAAASSSTTATAASGWIQVVVATACEREVAMAGRAAFGSVCRGS